MALSGTQLPCLYCRGVQNQLKTKNSKLKTIDVAHPIYPAYGGFYPFFNPCQIENLCKSVSISG